MDGTYPSDSKDAYNQDRDNLKPVFDEGPANGADLEKCSKTKKILNTLFPCARVYRSTKGRYGLIPAVVATAAILLVFLSALGGIIFGIIVGAEKGLTG